MYHLTTKLFIEIEVKKKNIFTFFNVNQLVLSISWIKGILNWIRKYLKEYIFYFIIV